MTSQIVDHAHEDLNYIGPFVGVGRDNDKPCVILHYLSGYYILTPQDARNLATDLLLHASRIDPALSPSDAHQDSHQD